MAARTDTAGPAAILAGQTDPAVARRAWPRWLAAGVGLVAVAVVAGLWSGNGGARLLLGVVGGCAVVRGAVLGTGPDGAARRLGRGTATAGLAALVVAALPGTIAGWVLLAGTPLVLAVLAGSLLTRGGAARRGGIAASVWLVGVTGLLVGVGLAGDWARARGGATLVAALAVAVLGLLLVAGATGLRAAAARPAPAPRPAGCAGCACGAGGCGAAAGLG